MRTRRRALNLAGGWALVPFFLAACGQVGTAVGRLPDNPPVNEVRAAFSCEAPTTVAERRACRAIDAFVAGDAVTDFPARGRVSHVGRLECGKYARSTQRAVLFIGWSGMAANFVPVDESERPRESIAMRAFGVHVRNYATTSPVLYDAHAWALLDAVKSGAAAASTTSPDLSVLPNTVRDLRLRLRAADSDPLSVRLSRGKSLLDGVPNRADRLGIDEVIPASYIRQVSDGYVALEPGTPPLGPCVVRFYEFDTTAPPSEASERAPGDETTMSEVTMSEVTMSEVAMSAGAAQ